MRKADDPSCPMPGAPSAPWLLAPASFTPADRDAAWAIVAKIAGLVGQAYPEVPIDTFVKLVQTTVGWIADGRAARVGLQLSSLCAQAKQSEKHLREHFGPRWQQAGELMVRLLMLFHHGPGVRWQLLKSLPTEARPSHHGLGRDHLPGKAAGVRLLSCAVGAPGRCMLPSSMIYTRGTCDDLSSERCEPKRIDEFEKECGQPIAGATSEHVDMQLTAADTVRKRVDERLAHSYPGLGERIFTPILIANALPYGPSTVRGVWHGQLAYPGDEPDTLEVFAKHDRHGIARCSPEMLEDVEREVPDSEWDSLQVAAGEFAGEHALDLDPRDSRFWWVPGREMLVLEDIGRTAVTSSLWLPVGLGGDRALAATLAALGRQSSPRMCIERAQDDCQWGLISVSSVWSDAALRTLLHVADAACVCAERYRRQEEMRALEGLEPSRRDNPL
jgi:hypothetical protein